MIEPIWAQVLTSYEWIKWSVEKKVRHTNFTLNPSKQIKLIFKSSFPFLFAPLVPRLSVSISFSISLCLSLFRS